MAIPGYQSFLLPLMNILSDQQKHTLRDLFDTLGDQFQLTEAERSELLPSGKQAKFENRIGWAATHLKKAGLLEKPGRGKLQITQRGLDVLKDKPTTIDSKFLQQFSEYLEFLGLPAQGNEAHNVVIEESVQTPEEILESSYQTLKDELAMELLQRLKTNSPQFFEQVVVDLLVAMGYGGSQKEAGQAIGKSGDGGIDGIINEDKLGLDIIYVQAKRWEGTVGRPTVQAFAGTLEGVRARKGVMITTSEFSKDARDYVTRIEKKIVLIDGQLLTDLMIEHNVGVTEQQRFVIKRIDSDYFDG